MKKIFITITILFGCYFQTHAQDYYLGNSIISYREITYKVGGGNDNIDWYGYTIENTENTLLNSLNYKTTDRSRYYSFATGYCHHASINENTLDWILRTVFNDELQRDSYTINKGYIQLYMAVSPFTGKVQEVEFRIIRRGGEDLSCISIDNFYMLEKLLKEHMVCTLPKEVVEESPTYVPCFTYCFAND